MADSLRRGSAPSQTSLRLVPIRDVIVFALDEAYVAVLRDDDGYDVGTLLAPNRLELCYLHLSAVSRVASCTEFAKQ